MDSPFSESLTTLRAGLGIDTSYLVGGKVTGWVKGIIHGLFSLASSIFVLIREGRILWQNGPGD